MSDFQNIANLNLVADTELTSDDQVVMVDTADGKAYKATVGQVADYALGHGLIAVDELQSKVTVDGAVVATTVSSTSDLKVNTDKFVVTASSGNTAVAGTLASTGDLKVNTNKFVVTASSGNTTIAGTLNLTGQAVTFGANDSGGTGYRLVVVPNTP